MSGPSAVPASAAASSITVAVRVRPFTAKETSQLSKADDGPVFLGDGSLAHAALPRLTQRGLRSVVKVVDDHCLVFDPPEDSPIQKFSRSVVPQQGKRVKDQTFAFDRVFDASTSQQDVYESTTRPLLDSVLDGYNATVFAYGATGCGKTHTITGTAEQPGIIFLAMQELFERIQELEGDKVTEISLSYLEIYNETIRDLLVPGGSKQALNLREDANQTVSVAGLTSHRPQNVQEVMDMIVCGNEYRTMSPTEANATSSRSHAVLQINVSQKDRNADINEPHTMATLSIIDLAGSERASATKNRGERLLEGANINKSLLALGSCINALCDGRRKQHVPYRNSKLTRLLKFSLGGNCRTVMIVCVSPSSAHFDESQNTLRYANRAKNIQTKVSRNVINVNRHVKDFLKKIHEQMAMIEELKVQQRDHEAVAAAKLHRAALKRHAILRDGLTRLRGAGADERADRAEAAGRLAAVDHRLAILAAWQAALPDPMPTSARGAAESIRARQADLGVIRARLMSRLTDADAAWARAIDSAAATGERQLREVDGDSGTDLLCLSAEAGRLRAEADRDRATAEAEARRGSVEADVAIVRSLVTAHLDTAGILAGLAASASTDEGAVRSARRTLVDASRDSIAAAVAAVGAVDGPERSRTSLSAAFSVSTQPQVSTPRKATPRRATPRKATPAKPGWSVDGDVSMSPSARPVGNPRIWRSRAPGSGAGLLSPRKKKTPGKRGVRWRDDEDGRLADFNSPARIDDDDDGDDVTGPDDDTDWEGVPDLDASVMDGAGPAIMVTGPNSIDRFVGRSPIRSPGADSKAVPARFQTGFLTKRPDGPTSMGSPSSVSSARAGSPARSSPSSIPVPLGAMRRTVSSDSGRGSLTGLGPLAGENTSMSGTGMGQQISRSNRTVSAESSSDPMRELEKVLRRTSLHGALRAKRLQRRRSSGSPTSPGPASALQALRRVNRAAETEWKTSSILSPRPAIVKQGGRRTTVGGGGISRLGPSVGGTGLTMQPSTSMPSMTMMDRKPGPRHSALPSMLGPGPSSGRDPAGRDQLLGRVPMRIGSAGRPSLVGGRTTWR